METEAPTRPRRRLSRLLFWGVLIASPFLFLLAWQGYEWYLDRDLRAAIAEADRLDPGWRLAELEAARAEIPDSDNAALQVSAARKLLPAGWFSPPPASPSTQLEDDLDQLPPVQRLDESQSKQIDAELVKATTALPAARRVTDMPRGRYVVLWTSNAIGTLLPHVQGARDIGRLLQLDAIRLAANDDIEGALFSCRAILNTGRSFGDETAAITQLVRLWYQRLALRTLERALAQGTASEAALVKMQQLLEDESEQPLLLIATRAERAGIHQFLEFVERGGHYRASFGMRSRTGSNHIDDLLDRGKARGCHAAYLRYLNECVEITKLPPEQQVERLRDFDLRPPENVPQLLAVLGGLNVYLNKLAENFHHRLAFMRCGVAGVAVERYRLANGRWPERLEDLVPAYLSKIPIDLFDGQPLRFRRLKDGVIIYTVGEDQEDDGGQRVLIKASKPDRDVGFQLWDPKHRRQPSGKN
ncbi:MAG TPA: hypothetical protein VGX70_07610 [Gemmataceae bacterium]|nr:hypothetical protein [Gemmataceae bacterium]